MLRKLRLRRKNDFLIKKTCSSFLLFILFIELVIITVSYIAISSNWLLFEHGCKTH